jgi:hypothetical protein
VFSVGDIQVFYIAKDKNLVQKMMLIGGGGQRAYITTRLFLHPQQQGISNNLYIFQIIIFVMCNRKNEIP